MNVTPTDSRKAKKPYQRPEVVRYPLRPEEAVLGACKSSNAGGPMLSVCGVPLTPCSTAGS